MLRGTGILPVVNTAKMAVPRDPQSIKQEGE